MATENEFPMSDIQGPSEEPGSVGEVLDTLDASIAAVKDTLPNFDEEKMSEMWRVTNGDQTILEWPRAVFLRTVMFNHWYHHRGQFGVYLRLMGCSVPSSYGPSGDELPDFLKGVEMARA